eukprot:354406-Chlamydomonas_euryale.AAC.1
MIASKRAHETRGVAVSLSDTMGLALVGTGYEAGTDYEACTTTGGSDASHAAMALGHADMSRLGRFLAGTGGSAPKCERTWWLCAEVWRDAPDMRPSWGGCVPLRQKRRRCMTHADEHMKVLDMCVGSCVPCLGMSSRHGGRQHA